MMFDFLKRRSSIRRKPPEKKLKGRLVPVSDFEMLKFIRKTLVSGDQVVLDSSIYKGVNSIEFDNAQVLYDYYGMDNLEVLEITGFWVKETLDIDKDCD